MIRRDTYRFLKKLSREQLSKWLCQFYVEAYNAGIRDDQAAVFRRLVDDFDFTNEQIAELRQGKDEDVNSINEKYVTAEEIIEGLIGEGITNLQGG